MPTVDGVKLKSTVVALILTKDPNATDGGSFQPRRFC